MGIYLPSPGAFFTGGKSVCPQQIKIAINQINSHFYIKLNHYEKDSDLCSFIKLRAGL
jgi:hypothetical protein